MSEPYVWAMTDHACGACLARVLERIGDDGRKIFCCSNCGAEGEGEPGAICMCGARLGTRDAGLRCTLNPRPRPEFPAQVIVCEAA